MLTGMSCHKKTGHKDSSSSFQSQFENLHCDSTYLYMVGMLEMVFAEYVNHTYRGDAFIKEL